MDSVQGSSSEAMILRLIRSCANGISSKEVYEAVGLDRHTVAKHLATLEGLGLVSCRKIGMAKLWYPVKSALLERLNMGEGIIDEIKNILMDSPDRINIIDAQKNLIWANDTSWKGAKKCFERYNHQNEACIDCPAEKTIETGEKQSNIAIVKDSRGKDVTLEFTTAPIKDYNQNTIGVVEFVKKIEEGDAPFSKTKEVG